MMIVGLISGLPILALAMSFALHGSAGLCQSKPPSAQNSVLYQLKCQRNKENVLVIYHTKITYCSNSNN